MSEELVAELRNQLREREAVIRRLKKQKKELEEELVSVAEELEKLKAESSKADPQEMDELRKQLEETARERDELKSQLEAIERRRRIEQLAAEFKPHQGALEDIVRYVAEKFDELPESDDELKSALSELREKKPYLFAGSNGQGPEPRRPTEGPTKQIYTRSFLREFFSRPPKERDQELERDIRRAIAEGRIKDE